MEISLNEETKERNFSTPNWFQTYSDLPGFFLYPYIHMRRLKVNMQKENLNMSYCRYFCCQV